MNTSIKTIAENIRAENIRASYQAHQTVREALLSITMASRPHSENFFYIFNDRYLTFIHEYTDQSTLVGFYDLAHKEYELYPGELKEGYGIFAAVMEDKGIKLPPEQDFRFGLRVLTILAKSPTNHSGTAIIPFPGGKNETHD